MLSRGARAGSRRRRTTVWKCLCFFWPLEGHLRSFFPNRLPGSWVPQSLALVSPPHSHASPILRVSSAWQLRKSSQGFGGRSETNQKQKPMSPHSPWRRRPQSPMKGQGRGRGPSTTGSWQVCSSGGTAALDTGRRWLAGHSQRLLGSSGESASSPCLPVRGRGHTRPSGHAAVTCPGGPALSSVWPFVTGGMVASQRGAVTSCLASAPPDSSRGGICAVAPGGNNTAVPPPACPSDLPPSSVGATHSREEHPQVAARSDVPWGLAVSAAQGARQGEGPSQRTFGERISTLM